MSRPKISQAPSRTHERADGDDPARHRPPRLRLVGRVRPRACPSPNRRHPPSDRSRLSATCRSARAAPATRGSGCRRIRTCRARRPGPAAAARSGTVMISCTMPFFITTMRSAISTASSRSWVTNRMVLRVRACSSNSSACMVSRVCASSAPNGSSISSTLGSIGERARDADALLHAAGQLMRAAVERIREADELEVARRGVPQLAAAHALHLQAEHHVLQRRQPRQQLGELKHHAAIVAAAPHLAAVHRDLARRRGFEPHGDAQRRGLAAAARGR